MESIIVRKYRVLSIDSDWETTKQKQRKNESQMRIFRRIEFGSSGNLVAKGF